eukprot:TRINITY_DN9500_c0_g1_i4.p1 TRINITY_DN9500_c0_g1~~TRINITY_DN9500_c0_g1_i4.p1  ORF type:complete len:305 (+),score=38.06 TRINITY_DN9500_c0_g1_i4:82-996(+)
MSFALRRSAICYTLQVKQVARIRQIRSLSSVKTFDMSGSVVGFLGSGNMAEAMARGFIDKGVVAASQLICYDINQNRTDVFKSFGASVRASNVEVVQDCDIIFVCTKPQYVSSVLREAKQKLGKDKLVVSIAAGVSIQTIQEAAGEETRVIRVMPNTPCLVGETASAMALGKNASQEDAEMIKKLFSSVGQIFQVDESLLHAVTGLSGSGPAYVFVVIEALSDGGVRAGLPRDVAQKLAAQTVLGAAKMVIEQSMHPGQLKDMVTSPGGTTISGVHELERHGVRGAFIDAVVAATEKAKDLSLQ